jgi:hypothetical protein
MVIADLYGGEVIHRVRAELVFSDNHSDRRRQPTWPAASTGGRA